MPRTRISSTITGRPSIVKPNSVLYLEKQKKQVSLCAAGINSNKTKAILTFERTMRGNLRARKFDAMEREDLLDRRARHNQFDRTAYGDTARYEFDLEEILG